MADEEWTALFRGQRVGLVRFLVRRVGCAATAADLAQESFLRLLDLRPGQAVRDLRAYLFRIAANLAVDHVRSQRRHRVAGLEPAERLADQAPSPEDVALSRAELAALARAIEELPPRRRAVFLLHKLDGLSYGEIAARLGIAENTVSAQMVKALDHLRRRLERVEDGR